MTLFLPARSGQLNPPCVSIFFLHSHTDNPYMDDSKKVLGCIAALIGIPVLSAIVICINGWVLMSLWIMFIVPLGADTISYLHAAGLMTLVRFALPDPPAVKTDDISTATLIGKMVGEILLRPFFALLIGYLIHYCMVH